MINVGLVYPSGHLSVADVASNENISEKFLESIVANLKIKGLVKAKRGAGGGYLLNISPSKISIRNIIEAVENESSSFENEEETNETYAGFAIREVLTGLDKIIFQYLESKTLSDLIQLYEQQRSGEMYYI